MQSKKEIYDDASLALIVVLVAFAIGVLIGRVSKKDTPCDGVQNGSIVGVLNCE